MHFLILYGTSEGQTQKIAACIADIVRGKGHQATALLGNALPPGFSLDGYDGVIIGGSIHMSRYQPYIIRFVKENKDRLNTMPSAFFTVCMGIHSQRLESRNEAGKFSENFIKETGWHPAHIHTFAGAVKYTQYNFVMRFIMKMIARHEGGSTDTSHDHEYTDWDAVAHFANNFLDREITGQGDQNTREIRHG